MSALQLSVRRAHLLAALLLACACVEGASTLEPNAVEPVILSVQAPAPVMVGTDILVRGAEFGVFGTWTQLELADGVSLPLYDRANANEHIYRMTDEAFEALGTGEHALEIRVTDGQVESRSTPWNVQLGAPATFSIDAVPNGGVHYNDVAIVRGTGFLAEGEGSVSARFVGAFALEENEDETRAIDAILPVTLVERFDRQRASIVLSTVLGGIEPGTFVGTVQLWSDSYSGGRTELSPIPTTLAFGRPELFGFGAQEASLEQIVTVRGAGFVGGMRQTTLLRMQGTFTPRGGEPEPFGPEEVLPEFASGAEVRWTLHAEVAERRLVSTLFDHAQGRFSGTVTPVIIEGTREVAGTPAQLTLTLGPVRQVVWLKFLPGFYDSLARFGLTASAGELENRIVERMERIYQDWPVDIRLEVPADVSSNGYTTVEIGGPDPNNQGLFGYDNTPGKDVGNLRLFDKLGGANAETQADGAEGYGGVFVESFLFWSSHPELPSGVPANSPDPEPLFDEIFDPVRNEPATLAEVQGEGPPSRVEAVARAVRALSSMIGETTAHEFGHSLGLADPWGPADAFHNSGDEPGCLMDAGSARAFGERVDEPGFAEPTLCYDEPDYFREIFGT